MVEEGAEVVMVVNDVPVAAEDNILVVVDETEVIVLGSVVLEVAGEADVEADVVKGADVFLEINVEAAVVAPFAVMARVLVAKDVVVLVDVAGGAPSVVEEPSLLVASATVVVRDVNMAVAAVVVAELVVTDCLVEEGEEMVLAAGELE